MPKEAHESGVRRALLVPLIMRGCIKLPADQVESAEPARPLSLNVVYEETAVLSGYMPSFTSSEEKMFEDLCAKPNGVFFTHSFKWLSRNPTKLLAGMERMLRSGGLFVTSNYLISPAYCARRIPLIRPAHVVREMWDRVGDLTGVTARHGEILTQMAQRQTKH
jgi:hypothetical protein